MKKIIFSFLALAALAACTKSEIEYTQNQEIGFAPYSKTATKVAETTADYNDDLPIYVFANAGTNAAAPGDYTTEFLKNAKFSNRTADPDNIFGGDPDPYYWPNEHKLVFAGFSTACNSAELAVLNEGAPAMDFTTNTLSIDGYVQSTGTNKSGDNDLMWFPTTTPYARQTTAVPVTMYHACSWITIKIYGDGVTAKSGKEWKIKSITINDLTTKGDVDCTMESVTTDGTTTTKPKVTWNFTNTTDANKNQGFVVFSGENSLSTTATNVGFENILNNTIVLPQTATNMDIQYSYTTPAGATITETSNVSLALDKSASPAAGANDWKAGYHYTYLVKVTATEILINPIADKWDEYTPAIPETTI